MRRISGPPQPPNFYLKRALKMKSPPSKSKNKLTNETSTNQTLPIRKSQSFHHKIDSTITTKPKKTTKSKQKPKSKLKKYEKEIMSVLNNAATLIQRQWRKYMIRKYRKSMSQIEMFSSLYSMHKEKSGGLAKEVNNEEKGYVCRFDEKSASNYTNENYSSYNNGKYMKSNNNDLNQAFNFNISQNKIRSDRISQRSSVSEFSHERRISDLNQSPQICIQSKQQVNRQNRIPKLIKSANYITNHHRTTSDKVDLHKTNQLSHPKTNPTVITKSPNLSLLPNTITLKIQPQLPTHKRNPYDDCFVVEQKTVIDEMLKKVQQSLEKKKLKKMLDLQNSFQNNMVTFRSYQKNKSQIYEEHIEILELKKRKLYDKWKEIIQLSKDQQHPEDKLKYLNPLKTKLSPLQISQPKKLPRLESESSKQLSQITQNLGLQINFDSNKKSIQIDDWQWSSDRKINQLRKINMEEEERIYTQIERIKCNQENLLAEISGEEVYKERGDQSEEEENLATKQVSVNNNCNNQQIIRIQELESYQGPQSSSNKKQAQYLYQQSPTSQQNPHSDSKIQQLKNSPPKQQEPISAIFKPINPTIEYVNNWLLDISHFILDNYNIELTQKLIKVSQPNPIQLYNNTLHMYSQKPHTYTYRVINQKQFQTFQYYHIKNLIQENRIEQQFRDTYAALTYSFHQALYESLNRMLEDELLCGKNWLNYPWFDQFKVAKIIGEEHGKQCLEKAINRVSSIADYTIFPVAIPSQQRNIQSELAQYILVLLQEVYQIGFDSPASKTVIVSQLIKLIQINLIEEQCRILLNLIK